MVKRNNYEPINCDEIDCEEYAKIKPIHRGYEFIYMDKVYQLIDVLIKKGVITVKDLDGYKKIKKLKNQVKELDKNEKEKYQRKEKRTI